MATRVISLNVWGGQLHGLLISYIAQSNPDILCLQEVVRTPATSSDWLLYRDQSVELRQRAHLYDEICAALPDHQAIFHPAARGILFDGEKAISSEFGLATFVRKSYSIIAQATDFVHGEFSSDGWGLHPRARNAHAFRLFDHSGDFSCTIAHMHGLRDLTGKADTPERIEQAAKLTDLIRRIWKPGERLIVCGDFNVLPGSVTFKALADLGLVDLMTSNGYTDTRTSYYGKAGRFADYLLASDEVRIVRFEVVTEPEVSDHRALLLDME